MISTDDWTAKREREKLIGEQVKEAIIINNSHEKNVRYYPIKNTDLIGLNRDNPILLLCCWCHSPVEVNELNTKFKNLELAMGIFCYSCRSADFRVLRKGEWYQFESPKFIHTRKYIGAPLFWHINEQFMQMK